MTHKFFYPIFFIVLLVFVSCNENITNPQKEKVKVVDLPSYWISDNAVHFKDISSFNKKLTELGSSTEQQLVLWEKTINFDNSLRKKYSLINSNLEKKDDLDEDVLEEQKKEELMKENLPYITNLAITSLINDRGILFIGDSILKITSKYSFLIKNGDKEIIAQIEKNEELDFPQTLKKKINGVLKNAQNLRTAEFMSQIDRTVYPYESIGVNDRRVQLTYYAQDLTLIQNFTVRIKPEVYRKTCFICGKKWVSSNANNVQLFMGVNCRWFGPECGELWCNFSSDTQTSIHNNVSELITNTVTNINTATNSIQVLRVCASFSYNDDGLGDVTDGECVEF